MRNPFRKKPVTNPVTNPAYARWLRAQSPQPLAFFMGLSEVEQETLAMLGDDYIEDQMIAVAYAIADPDAAAMGVGREEEDMEEQDLASRVGAAIVARHSPAQAPPARRPLTMGGVTKRRLQHEQDDQEARNEGRSLFGRAPDPINFSTQPDPVALAQPKPVRPKSAQSPPKVRPLPDAAESGARDPLSGQLL